MKRDGLKLLLALSLLLNLGVVGAVAYRAYQEGRMPDLLSRHSVAQTSLPDHLKLSGDQRRQWHELEAGFFDDLKADWRELGVHRERMIGEIFSQRPDRGRIESERMAIASLQARQQQRIIEQLLKERAILNPEQQAQLAALLKQQAPAASLEEQLHGK